MHDFTVEWWPTDKPILALSSIALTNRWRGYFRARVCFWSNEKQRALPPGQ
jgi:hypothetical protein